MVDPERIGLPQSSISNDPLENTIREVADEARTRLLCKQCDVVYDDYDEWSHCPRCGVELNEAEIA